MLCEGLPRCQSSVKYCFTVAEMEWLLKTYSATPQTLKTKLYLKPRKIWLVVL